MPASRFAVSAAVSGDRFVIGTDGSGGKVLCFGK